MAKFQIKISMLSPEARCNDHPLYREKEIVLASVSGAFLTL